MTQEQAARSVSIAEEVLKHLHDWNIAPGAFIDPRGDDVYASTMDGDDMSYHIPETRKVCRVCALGACFISMLDVTDTPCVLDPDEAKVGMDFERMEPLLRDAIGERNMTLIEVAFERGRGYYENSAMFVDRTQVTAEEYNDAREFGRLFPVHRDRLKAIMQNVVGNRGAFQPGEVAIA